MRALISSERMRLIRKLKGFGLHVVPGEANYLLFFCEVRELAEKLQLVTSILAIGTTRKPSGGVSSSHQQGASP